MTRARRHDRTAAIPEVTGQRRRGVKEPRLSNCGPQLRSGLPAGELSRARVHSS